MINNKENNDSNNGNNSSNNNINVAGKNAFDDVNASWGGQNNNNT